MPWLLFLMNWIAAVKIHLLALSLNFKPPQRIIQSNSFGCLEVIELSRSFNSFMRVVRELVFLLLALNIIHTLF